jgi:hypothetical protein
VLQIKVIAIIAEGIPEHLTRQLNEKAQAKGVTIIGPATVGGIKPGCFKIGNTGGMIDNIIASKLYRPGRWVNLCYAVLSWLSCLVIYIYHAHNDATQRGLRLSLWWHEQ